MAVVAAAFLCFGSDASAQKTTKLFNGKDLSGWNFVVDKNSVPAEQVFRERRCHQHHRTAIRIHVHERKIRDYKLHEYRWPNGKEKANSGIFLLIEEPKNPFPNGIECNLMLDNAGDFVLLGGSDLTEYQNKPGQPRPSFPKIQKANQDSEKPAGEWNEANIFVKNGVITVYINGVYQNTGTNKVKEGYIGLQSEGKEVQFRNVTITPW